MISNFEVGDRVTYCGAKGTVEDIRNGFIQIHLDKPIQNILVGCDSLAVGGIKKIDLNITNLEEEE